MKDDINETRFLGDVKDHVIEVLRDDGVNRHIRLRKPGSMCMHFDLITWPGYLCYTGDMGTYVFSRLTDMFQFFRVDREYAVSKHRQLCINPSYWGEKVQAQDKGDGLKVFSEDKFRRAVMDRLVEWIRDTHDRTSKEERRDLWDQVISEVIDADGDSGGFRKQSAAHDFSHLVNKDVGYFQLTDFWDCNVQEYSYRFMWCCYAMAWGIAKYDNIKADAKATSGVQLLESKA